MSRLDSLRRLLGRGGKGPAGPRRPPAPFIVGAPRSGTTLLRLMMDAHPELAIPPETYFIPRAAKAWRAARRRPSEDPAEALIEAVTSHTRWPDFHLDAAEYAQRVRERRPSRPGDAIRAFYELYAERLGKPRWGDKTPFYVRKMDAIHRVLPEARFVHIIRDGRGVALSIKDLWFGPDTFAECAEFWVARIDEGRDLARELPHYMELRYEDLVSDPEAELRRICAFCELSFDPRMLTYYERVAERVAGEAPPQEIAPDGRVVSPAERRKIMENVSRPPDPSRLERWRTDMPAAERRRFEQIAGERLRELGYPVG